MSEILKKFVMSRQAKLESDRVTQNERMQEVADYVSPHRDDIMGVNIRNSKVGRKIFDGTAVSAAVIAADGIHGYHVSPAFAWFKYAVNRKHANQVAAIRVWLDEVEWNMYQALNRSNFYDEMWGFIYDGFTVGTAAICAEEDTIKERIVFETVHPGECYIAENRYGEVDVFHRKRKMTAKKMVEVFGENKCPEPVKNAYINDPFLEFDVIHAVYPREEFDSRKKDKKNKPYASVWVMPDSGAAVLQEGGFNKFPYHVWRYLRTGKSPYGVSPAILAMPEIVGLNLMAKTLLAAAQFAVDPAYNVPAYLLGKTKLMPRGLNYMTNPSDRITPINTADKYPIGVDREQAKQKAIRDRFHVDTFLMLSQMSGGQRTAYEVSEMMSEKAAILGAELGPFNTVLSDILEAVYDIEVNAVAQRMPKPPDELIEMAHNDNALRFDPVFMGPLAQAQRERFEKDGTRKFVTDIGALVNLQAATGSPPELLDNFDLDVISRHMAASSNLIGDGTRDQGLVSRIRQGRQQAQQEQHQQAQAQAAMQGAKTMSEADRNLGGKLSQALTGAAGPLGLGGGGAGSNAGGVGAA